MIYSTLSKGILTLSNDWFKRLRGWRFSGPTSAPSEPPVSVEPVAESAMEPGIWFYRDLDGVRTVLRVLLAGNPALNTAPSLRAALERLMDHHKLPRTQGQLRIYRDYVAFHLYRVEGETGERLLQDKVLNDAVQILARQCSWADVPEPVEFTSMRELVAKGYELGGRWRLGVTN